ncbi:hypothetical protein GIB67_039512 [Kingdonia uniflora]|uniref:Aminotransferase-like plant mobile domain-containing protein n=1 Tax=Kingdonia uniflora TaxID=39325 RepID=A0A7J7LJ38_9MAGN|nr:hypothetical protein GIB67_039512 [Kingdonia uniflora]
MADLDEAAQYDWGSTILASMYHGLDTAVTMGGAITGFAQLLMYWFYEYCGAGYPIVKEDIKCWKQLTGTTGIPLDLPLSMSPHLSPADLQVMRQADFVDCEQFVIGEERETYASYCVNQTVETTGEVATLRRHFDSVDGQLHEHDLHLRRGHDVRVVPLPPGGGVRAKQHGSGPRTRGGGSGPS